MSSEHMHDETFCTDLYVTAVRLPGLGHRIEFDLEERGHNERYVSRLTFTGVFELKVDCWWNSEELELVIDRIQRMNERSTPNGAIEWDWIITFRWPLNRSVIRFTSTGYEYVAST